MYFFRSSPRDFFVVVGSNRISKGGTRYNVSEVTWNQGYNPQRILNDVAVLRLSKNITFGGNVAKIGLDQGYVAENSSAVLSGWGTTKYPGSVPDDLQYINLTTISYSKCKARYGFIQVFLLSHLFIIIGVAFFRNALLYLFTRVWVYCLTKLLALRE